MSSSKPLSSIINEDDHSIGAAILPNLPLFFSIRDGIYSLNKYLINQSLNAREFRNYK